MKNTNKTIICDGDSWVFGCEIIDPLIKEKNKLTNNYPVYDKNEENDKYRIPRIFSTHLGQLFNSNVINLSYPADDNGTILHRIISYISANFIQNGKLIEDIFVIIGWSSPERNFFWYKDDNFSKKFILWPNVKVFDNKNQKQFWDYYIKYLWNEEEYLPRYIMNISHFQSFCKSYGIKWLCFNSFYDINTKLINPNVGHPIYDLKSNNRETFMQDYISIWNTINNVNFYKKDQLNNTFRYFMETNNKNNPYNGTHPSPESHKLWAEELYNYINENNILNEQ